jgi:hypothetical protein
MARAASVKAALCGNQGGVPEIRFLALQGINMTSWPKPDASQVASMLRQKGFVIKKEGREIVCSCPDPGHSNQDKDPTLCISSETGDWTCHGGKHSGTRSGDFYDLAYLMGEKHADWAKELGVAMKGERPVGEKALAQRRPTIANDMRGFLPENFERFGVKSNYAEWVFPDGFAVVKHSFRVHGVPKCLEPPGPKSLWPPLKDDELGLVCYVTEGRFDAMALMTMSETPAYAMGGAPNTVWLKALFETYTRVVFSYDKDKAGDAYLDVSLQYAITNKHQAWVLPLPEGWDPNDLLIAGLPLESPVRAVIENTPPKLDVDDNDRPYKTPRNLRTVVGSDYFSYQFGDPWVNTMGKVLMLGDSEYLNVHAIQFRHWIFDEFYLTWPKDEIHDTYSMVAHANQVNPVADYLNELVWDGAERLDRMLDVYFTMPASENCELKASYLKKWMISAVARALDPGCKVDSMIVLVSPQQGIGKSSFARALAGDWFLDGQLDPESKDCTMILHKHWIAELSELDATTRKKDMAHLRSFISRQEDVVRVPYGRVSETFKRGFVFIGTTNDEGVIREKEARRYWPIKVESIDHRGVLDDRDLLWAEAVHLYNVWVLQGKVWDQTPWILSPEEEALHRIDTVKFSPQEPLEEVLTQWFQDNTDSRTKEGGYRYKDFTEFLKGIDMRKPDFVIQEVLAKMGVVKGSGRQRYIWFPPTELFG